MSFKLKVMWPTIISVFFFTGEKMCALGLSNGKLSACKGAWNCAITQEVDKETPTDNPLYYTMNHHEAFEQLKKIILDFPRADIISQTDEYIHATFTSKFFRFIDDIECYLPKNKKVIHFRSASRSGFYDFGVNKNRINSIKKTFQKYQKQRS